jgi:hypothetical protein
LYASKEVKTDGGRMGRGRGRRRGLGRRGRIITLPEQLHPPSLLLLLLVIIF